MTNEYRELLDRTGRLFTKEDTDPGHISDFWRRKLVELCDLLDSMPLDIADQLHAEKAAHAQTRAALAETNRGDAALRARLAAEEDAHAMTIEKLRPAELLVHQAVPRMRTLNNSMSPDWLRRAKEFLGG